MNQTGRVLASYPVAPLGVEQASDGVVAGPDGNMWATSLASERITPQGVVPGFLLQANANPRRIIVGPADNFWFTESGSASSLGRFTPNGVLTEFGAASGLRANASPVDLTLGSDGNIWFTELASNKIGRFIL